MRFFSLVKTIKIHTEGFYSSNMLAVRFCYHLDSTPIDTRQLGAKDIAAKIKQAVQEVAQTNNAPAQRRFTVSNLFYEVRLLSTLKPYTEQRLDALLREYATTKDKRLLDLRVALVPQHAADHILAVVMALHPRIGRGSPMSLLSADIVRTIVQQMLVFRWE